MVRTALVTGGSGGIGSACVRALAPDHHVAVQYRSNESAATALVDELGGAGTEVRPVQADVTEADAVVSMVETVTDDLGAIDVLVNSAGVMKGKGITELSPSAIEQVLSINLYGTILCTRAVLPAMLELDRAHIVNVASTAGTHGSHGDPVYGASKGGQVAFTRSLASAYTDDGLFTNAVAPGAVETEMFPDEWVAGVERSYPLGRLVRPSEVADAVRFLAETTCISGEVLEIDQGKLI